MARREQWKAAKFGAQVNNRNTSEGYGTYAEWKQERPQEESEEPEQKTYDRQDHRERNPRNGSGYSRNSEGQQQAVLGRRPGGNTQSLFRV
eukprot:5905080-Pyramimonas_sp.AAC.3